jgi:hydrogenase expression/formation protein HypE
MATSSLPHLEGPVCPLPLSHPDQIVMGHGSGGQMTQQLIASVFQSRLTSEALAANNDFGSVALPDGSQLKGRVVVSTDSHIVAPLVFPGGDIGKLAVCGTVNDVSMSGAVPLYLTAGFILEEGLPIRLLEQIVDSMRDAAQEAGVQFVAGDTKVVEKGKADGIFINTTGLGWLPEGLHIGGECARAGDVVLVSGTLGDHGIAVLAARGDLDFDTGVQSDTAPLNGLIQTVLQAAPHTHVLRDPTRGGLATTLNEIAAQSKVAIHLDETAIPVNPVVRSACEFLGFDPLYIANEGKVIVIVPPNEAEAALDAMRRNPYGQNAAMIGVVEATPVGLVLLKTIIGGTRVLNTLAGEILPRIC